MLHAYVDGVAQTISSSTATTPSNFGNFGFDPAFAARNVRGPISSQLNGTLDEVALYSSTLTAADAQAHFAAMPESAGFALLALGGIALFQRRRR